MSTDTTQYLSTTEFANRYNAMMPIDKDHLPLEPSFVELLCKKGEIEHSELQPGKGNKKYIYKIPEYELDRVAILINGDEFVKVEKEQPEPVASAEEELLNAKQVAELTGYDYSWVTTLAKCGSLPSNKTARESRGRGPKYLFKKSDVLAYMEENPRRERKKKEKPVEAETVQESKESEDLSKFQKRIDELLDALNDAQKAIQILTDENMALKDRNSELEQKATQEPVAKDIFEAYRKGFKDGYEMGGKR